MVRREDIEEQLNKDRELLKKLEDKRRFEDDPRRYGKWENDIEEVKQRIHQREKELKFLATRSVQPPIEVELRSERGVDYTQLRDLLAAQRWKKADLETFRVMFQAPGLAIRRITRTCKISFDPNNFPCKDLRTINQLWLRYSGGKFGFSVQKEIYLSIGGTGEYDWEFWNHWGEKVGWERRGRFLNSWEWGEWRYLEPLRYYQLTFNLAAPRGHLPALYSIPLKPADARLLNVRRSLEDASLSLSLSAIGFRSLEMGEWRVIFPLWQRLVTCKV